MPRCATLDQAGRRRAGVGEGAALVTEKLVLDERVGNGAAVDRHERPVAPRAPIVNRPRRQFLAGAGLAFDDDRDLELGDAIDERKSLEKGGQSAHEPL